MTTEALSKALRRLWQPALFGVALVLVLWGYFSSHNAPGVFAFDFRGTLYQAAEELAAGRSPYPAPNGAGVAAGNPAVYPPLTIIAAIPLTWLGWNAAVAVWVALIVGGALGGVWLLGVRDWRCYCVVLASLPFVDGVLWGNITLLLLLGVGAAWRWRGRPVVCGLAVGAVVAAKLFLWPLLLWLILLRRYRAAGWAGVWTIGLIFVPWALIGFRGLRDYPELVRTVSDLYGTHTSSLLAAGVGAGLPLSVARVLPLFAGVLLLVVAAFASRRSGADRRVFAIAVVAALAASPIVWTYYLVLLVAPVAVLRPRLSWLWLVVPAPYLVDQLHGDLKITEQPPPGAFYAAWGTLHSAPPLWPAIGVMALLAALAACAAGVPLRGRDAS